MTTTMLSPDPDGTEQVLWIATSGPQTIRAVLRCTDDARIELRIAYGTETLASHLWTRFNPDLVQDVSMRTLGRWTSNGWRLVEEH